MHLLSHGKSVRFNYITRCSERTQKERKKEKQKRHSRKTNRGMFKNQSPVVMTGLGCREKSLTHVSRHEPRHVPRQEEMRWWPRKKDWRERERDCVVWTGVKKLMWNNSHFYCKQWSAVCENHNFYSNLRWSCKKSKGECKVC